MHYPKPPDAAMQDGSVPSGSTLPPGYLTQMAAVGHPNPYIHDPAASATNDFHHGPKSAAGPLAAHAAYGVFRCVVAGAILVKGNICSPHSTTQAAVSSTIRCSQLSGERGLTGTRVYCIVCL